MELTAQIYTEVLADFDSESILGPNRSGGVDDWVYYLGVYLT